MLKGDADSQADQSSLVMRGGALASTDAVAAAESPARRPAALGRSPLNADTQSTDRATAKATGASSAKAAPRPALSARVEQGLKPARALAERYDQWRNRISMRLSNLDMAPDLARDIGSRRWLRGAGTLVVLSAVALAAWPDFSALDAAPAMTLNQEQQDEFRSRSIMPLALGADTGRRMAPTTAVVPLANAPERPRIDIEASFSGNSFAAMLRKAGVADGEARRVEELVAGVIQPADLSTGTKVDIALGRRPAQTMARPLESLSFRARFDLQLAVERQNDRLTLVQKPITVDSTPLRVRGPVGDSLYRSARASGAPANAVQHYLRALSSELNLESGVRPTDEFDMIVEYKRAATGEVEVGNLLYAGVVRGGKPLKQMVRWGSEGRFFEATGVGELRQGLIAPVSGRVSSNYGMRRHPILGYNRMHRGMDFRAGHGTPIYAVTDGRVTMAGRNGGHGNYVRLAHSGGLATGYSHMSRISVRNGQQVKRGQIIGYVGSTGLSTGPHLHYEMYRNGAYVNPSSVKFVTRALLEGAELRAFRSKTAELQQVPVGAALNPLAPQTVTKAAPVREIDRIDTPQKI